MIIKTFAILTYLTATTHDYKNIEIVRFDNLNECLTVKEYLINHKTTMGYFDREIDIKDLTQNMECKELEYPTNE